MKIELVLTSYTSMGLRAHAWDFRLIAGKDPDKWYTVEAYHIQYQADASPSCKYRMDRILPDDPKNPAQTFLSPTLGIMVDVFLAEAARTAGWRGGEIRSVTLK